MGELRTTAGQMPADVRPDRLDPDLMALARARPELAWPVGADISTAHNAHATNTRAELADALAKDFTWLESDVRLDQFGTPVLQHEVDDRVDQTLEQWLEIGSASGRGLKLDIKGQAPLAPTIAAVQKARIPSHRLIINVGVHSADDLRSIRRAFPEAIINISPTSDADLTAADIMELQVAARIVGGKVMFPIRHDLVTRGVVAALNPFGRVAVWNTPELTNPNRHSVDRMRSLGVTGMIDLREPVGFAQTVQSTMIGVTASLIGWGPVHSALDALGFL